MAQKEDTAKKIWTPDARKTRTDWSSAAINLSKNFFEKF